jgi:hypothetical protein
MSNILVLAGERFNLFSRVPAANVVVSDEDALYAKDRLGDGRPFWPFRFGTLGADRQITIDGNLLINSVIGSWTAGTPASWTEANASGGDVVETTVGAEVHGGTGSAAKFVPGASGTAQLQQDVIVRAGERLNIEAWLLSDGTGGVMRFRIYNPHSAHYLKTDGTWASTTEDLFTEAGGNYSQKTKAFTVESQATLRSELTTLRIIGICNSANKVGFLDDVTLWPDLDFASVHGHNLDAGIVAEWRHSTDAFGSSNDLVGGAAVPVYRPSFYSAPATGSTRRWHRLKAVGTNSAAAGAIYYGEAVLGQRLSLVAHPAFPMRIEPMLPTLRGRMGVSANLIELHGRAIPRRLTLPFDYAGIPEYQEARDAVYQRTLEGFHPLVIVPDDADPEVCVWGRLVGGGGYDRGTWSLRHRELVIEEEAFPRFVG